MLVEPRCRAIGFHPTLLPPVAVPIAWNCFVAGRPCSGCVCAFASVLDRRPLAPGGIHSLVQPLPAVDLGFLDDGVAGLFITFKK